MLKKKEAQREVSNDEVYTVGIIASGEIYKWIKIEDEVEKTLGLGNIRIYNYRPFSKKDVPSYKYFTEKDFNWKDTNIGLIGSKDDKELRFEAS